MSYHPKQKPGFDDSARSGATHLDVSDRSYFDGINFFDASCNLPRRSCLLVKTQDDSLRQPQTSEKPSVKRTSTTSTSSTISFDTVSFRKYDVIVTDNPSTTSGPPIGLGWSYDQTDDTFNVDDYEDCREKPRSKRELRAPASVRWEMLHLAGTPNAELRKASEQVKQRQAQRRRSLQRQERIALVLGAIRCLVPKRNSKKQ